MSNACLGIRVIAERVVVRIQGETTWNLVEMDLEQARHALASLRMAVATLEAEKSVMGSFADFMSTLPRKPRLLEGPRSPA